MNDLAQMIKASIAKKQSEKELLKNLEATTLSQKVAALQPLKTAMQDIEDYGFKLIMHTDKSHLPCPAIHVKSVHGGNAHYDYFGEVYMEKEGKIYSGGCNMHNNHFENETEFLQFLADKVALIRSK